MPMCLLLRYAEEMSRVRAIATLDMAQAAAYPHLGKGARNWWDSKMKLVQRAARAVKQLFTFNGQAMTPEQLRSELGRRLGGGFEAR